MNKTIRPTAILFALAVLGLLGLLARQLTRGPADAPRPSDIAAASRIEAPPLGSIDEQRPLPEPGLVGGAGIVEPAQRETKVAVAAPGVVRKILFKEGDKVSEGEVIMELDRAVEEAAVKTAEADIASARANLAKTLNGQRPEDWEAAEAERSAAKARAELSATAFARAEQLFKGGAMTQEELDKARLTAAADKETANVAASRARAAEVGLRAEDIAAARATLAAAEARLAQAEVTLDRRLVRAPYGGEILQVKARVGEYVAPGAGDAPLILGDVNRLRARMDVDERDLGRVRIGQGATIVVDAFPGEKFRGKVAEIGRRMGRKNVRTDDPTERLDTKILEVVIDLDPTDKLVPGLRLTSYIEVRPGTG